MQMRLEDVGVLTISPASIPCIACGELTPIRCLWCNRAVCSSHAFTGADGVFCWSHLLEVLFPSEGAVDAKNS
jgi:hypothetical protein